QPPCEVWNDQTRINYVRRPGASVESERAFLGSERAFCSIATGVGWISRKDGCQSESPTI
ncbi:MAG: hypothetical protein ACE5HT_07915, partial [Gemmatimonadales bacterium]